MKIKIRPEHRPYIIEIAIWFVIALVVLVLAFGLHYYLVVYKNTYNLKFTDIDGIIKGSPVRFLGVVVGIGWVLVKPFFGEIVREVKADN